PEARGGLLGFGAEFIDDAGDGDKLDLVRIADEDFIEKDVAARVIVTIDETGHDRHLLCVECLRSLADERLGFSCVPDVDEPSTFDGKRLSIRHPGIDGVDLGIEYHQISVARIGVCARRFGKYGCTWKTTARKSRYSHSGQAQEFPTTVAMSVHRSFPPAVISRTAR